ncbi:MAG: tetratricopeptide repeat protein [Nocardioides sp.]
MLMDWTNRHGVCWLDRFDELTHVLRTFHFYDYVDYDSREYETLPELMSEVVDQSIEFAEFRDDPEEHLPTLVDELLAVSLVQDVASDSRAAVESAEHSVGISRDLLTIAPYDYLLARHAAALSRLGEAYVAVGDWEGARPSVAETVEVRRRVAASGHGRDIAALVVALIKLVYVDLRLDAQDRAEAVLLEAIRSQVELARRDPPAHQPRLDTMQLALSAFDTTDHSDRAAGAPGVGADFWTDVPAERSPEYECELIDGLADAMALISLLPTEAAASNSLPGVWESAIIAMSRSSTRAEVRAKYAAWLWRTGDAVGARREFTAALVEVDSSTEEPSGYRNSEDGTESSHPPRQPPVPLGRARRSLRELVGTSVTDGQELPSWASQLLHDEHVRTVALLAALVEPHRSSPSVDSYFESLDPDHHEHVGIVAMAAALYRLVDDPEFRATFDLLVDLFPERRAAIEWAHEVALGFADSRLVGAQQAFAAGDLDTAVTMYQELVEAKPSDERVSSELAMSRVQLRVRGVNVEAAQRAAAEPRDIGAQTLAADLEFVAGNLNEAFDVLVRAVARLHGAERDRAREHLIELFRAAGEHDARVQRARRDLASVLY